MRETLSSTNGVTWSDVAEPAAEELAAVVRAAQLSPLDAEFIAQEHHRPDLSSQSGYLMILVSVPAFDKQTRVTTSVPLYFIVQEHDLTTVHYQPLPALRRLWQDFTDNKERRDEYFAEGPLSLALHLIDALHAASLRKLDRLTKHVAIAEDAIFHGNERKMVEEISVLMRDVLDFRSIIRPQLSLFTKVPDHALLTAEARGHFARLHGQVHKLWEVLEGLLESTSELRDTNDSLLQHKENQLLRVLSYYSIITIPAWIFVTPFQPFAEDSTRVDSIFFWGVLSILVVLLAGIFWRFRGRGVL
ncbi:hypothetical protein IH781_02885 [Patescibacteria group bacterium]|nr:hypothetical protein [Patescibacteria group bacterium]